MFNGATAIGRCQIPIGVSKLRFDNKSEQGFLKVYSAYTPKELAMLFVRLAEELLKNITIAFCRHCLRITYIIC